MDLFSRLACLEAISKIDALDKEQKATVLYPKWTLVMFQFLASAGACAIWFGGSWWDILVAGLCGILVGYIGTLPILSREQRLIFEALASFSVGLVAGLVSIRYPTQLCYGAIAISGVLDILQGFRTVYAVIEIMSKHTVSGTADFLEGIFYTGLIAFFLRAGLEAAATIMDEKIVEDEEFLQCNEGIDPLFYIVWAPVAAFSWSGMFSPDYKDLPWMTFHGILAYVVSWLMGEYSTFNEESQLFVASMCVTFSAGVVSRFTGRQALGNTVSGLYVVLPGAYLVKSLFAPNFTLDFLAEVFFKASVIGVGAWTGSILCSPTLLGTNVGMLKLNMKYLRRFRRAKSNPGLHVHGEETEPVRRDRPERPQNGTGTILFF